MDFLGWLSQSTTQPASSYPSPPSPDLTHKKSGLVSELSRRIFAQHVLGPGVYPQHSSLMSEILEKHSGPGDGPQGSCICLACKRRYVQYQSHKKEGTYCTVGLQPASPNTQTYQSDSEEFGNFPVTRKSHQLSLTIALTEWTGNVWHHLGV